MAACNSGGSGGMKSFRLQLMRSRGWTARNPSSIVLLIIRSIPFFQSFSAEFKACDEKIEFNRSMILKVQGRDARKNASILCPKGSWY